MCGGGQNHEILCCLARGEGIFCTIALSQIALSAVLAATFCVMNQ
jgi:hypothetical protein